MDKLILQKVKFQLRTTSLVGNSIIVSSPFKQPWTSIPSPIMPANIMEPKNHQIGQSSLATLKIWHVSSSICAPSRQHLPALSSALSAKPREFEGPLMPVLGGYHPGDAMISHAISSSDEGLAVRPQSVVFRCSADIVQQVARDVRRAAETDPHLKMATRWTGPVFFCVCVCDNPFNC